MKHQPDVVCLQEHNQHSMARDVTFIGGYDIYYVGNSDFSGICMLFQHDLQDVLDPLGRWMVVQTCIQGEIYEFASVHAAQSSTIGCQVGLYCLLSIAVYCLSCRRF